MALRYIMRWFTLAFLFATLALSQHASQFAPAVRHKVNPEYTDEARKAHIQGTVVLYTKIGTDGRAHDIKVVEGGGLGYGLDEKAVECLKQWEFLPAVKDGEPVAVAETVEIKFRMDQ
jgi:protein TonB